MIFPILLFIFNSLIMNCAQASSCPAQLQENFTQTALKTVEMMKQDKEFQSFLENSLQQRDAVLEDKEFQKFVADAQAQIPLQKKSLHTSADLYIFVSFSLGEKSLLNLAQEAKAYGATLILRGFKDNSYAQTVKSLQNIITKTSQGVLIDPELFSLFSVKVAPTYVLVKPFQLSAQERTQTPLHDRLQGYVSVLYALETFATSGDLKQEAQALLEKRGLK
jgi:type-F conjugative transfer system pilin assembly protein TrbC